MSDKEQEALYIVRRLVDSGFRAVFAGGCVRDRILGVEPKDYDIATDARPEVVQKMFDRTVAVGAKFGVIGVVLDHDKPIEVATFRADAEYTDGRRPSSVRFGAIEEDAIRRDFTIGGMFYDPIADRLIDLVGGCAISAPESSAPSEILTTASRKITCASCAPPASPRGSTLRSIPRPGPR